MNWLDLLQKGPLLNLKVGNLTFNPSYTHAGLILLLLFFLVLTLAQVRRHFINWSFKGALFGLFLGFLLALIVEGFLVIGGRTAVTEILGWKNPPKPVSVALDAGKEKLINVLGTDIEISPSNASGNKIEELIKIIDTLSSEEKENLQTKLCR